MVIRKHSERRGNVAVFVAIALIPILGVVAIVCDGGVLMSDRREVQRAADSAALAAAVDFYTNWKKNGGADPTGSASNSAFTTATANGYANDGTTSVVTVNIPPKTGPFTGLNGYAEVLITYNQGRLFSSIWGDAALQVNARAVARGTYVPATAGIIVLDPTDNNTLNVTATGNVTVTNGGAIDVDSKSPNGGATCSNTGNIVASNINLSDGTYNATNTGNLIGQVNYNVPPAPDPLASLPPPSIPSLPTAPAATPGLNYSTSQGVNYSGSAAFAALPRLLRGNIRNGKWLWPVL
jgi:Flp pilus assembly protein TadG